MARRSSSASSVVGLDLEAGHATAAVVRANGSLVVERAVSAPLPPEAIREGEVASPEALGAALRAMFSAEDLPKRVRVGVAGARTAVRVLDLPPITDRGDLAAAVRFQAADSLPIPLDRAVLDYHALGVHETPDGDRMRVVVAAAQRDSVDRLVAGLRAAGLRVEGVDIAAFALVRALHRPARREGEDPERTSLYVNLGGLTNLAVAAGTTCLFTRATSNGLEAMVADLAPRHGITAAEARVALLTPPAIEGDAAEGGSVAGDPVADGPVEGSAVRDEPAEGGLPVAAAVEDGSSETEPVATSLAASVRDVIDAGVRRIADDVRTSLDFYGQQAGAQPITRVVAAGPLAALPGFVEGLSAQLDARIEVGEIAGPATGGAAFAVAAGLAVEEATA